MVTKLIRMSKTFNPIKSLWISSVIFWAIAISPVLRSSWAGDDWPNGQAPYWIEWRKGSLNFILVIQDALYWTRAWALGQGRFYPFAHIEGRLQFSYLQQLWQYKLCQYLLLVLCGIIFAILILRLSKSNHLAITTLFALSLTTQFRAGFDPHLAFSSMVASMLIKVFLASIIINYVATNDKKIKSLKLSYLSAGLYFAAMSTYEFAFLLFPLLLISYKIGIERSNTVENNFKLGKWLDDTLMKLFARNFRPILYSWLIYGLLVFGILRNIARDISGAYVLGLSIKSIPVFSSQIPTGLPLIKFSGTYFEKLFNNYISVLVLAILISSIYVLRKKVLYFKVDKTKYGISRIPLLLVSILLICTPGAILSLQVDWWNRASVSNTYLGVMITEFGTALLLAIFFEKFLFRNYVEQYSRETK
jgi:hypothetical protein